MKLLQKIFTALVFLTFSSSLIVAEPIDQLVTEWFISEYQLDMESYEVEFISSRLNVTDLQPEELSLKAISNKDPLGAFSLLAVVTRDNKVISRGQVRVKIRKFQSVLVAQERIRRHDLIEDREFVIKRVDVTSLRQQPVIEAGMLAGHRARLSIRKDQVITTELIELVPDIEVGHEVTIILHTDLLEITAPGRAMQSGSKGTLIRVKNNATGKVVLARVVDHKSVAVDI